MTTHDGRSPWRHRLTGLVAPATALMMATTLVLAALLTAPAGASGGEHHLTKSSAEAEAKAISMRAGDLPSTKPPWKSEAVPGSGKAAQAAAVKAAACMEKLGAASGDAFATLGKTAKSALANVSSPEYYQPGLTQLPGANSEVVVVSSPAVASKDLVALEKPAARACLAAQYVVSTEASGSGKVKVTTSTAKGPSEKRATGALRIRFTATGGNLPAGLVLYNDEYFYVSGNAEVVFSFLDLGSPFSTKWATSTIAKVMARAATAAS